MIFYQYELGGLKLCSEPEAVPTEKTFPQFAFQNGYSPYPTLTLGDPFSELHLQIHSLEYTDGEGYPARQQFLLQLFVGDQSFGIWVRNLPDLLAFVASLERVLHLAIVSHEKDEVRVHVAMHGEVKTNGCQYCRHELGYRH